VGDQSIEKSDITEFLQNDHIPSVEPRPYFLSSDLQNSIQVFDSQQRRDYQK
jgi:hypothetical protein